MAPWTFSRESQIRIDRDGHFWHEGGRVLHGPLERALASWVAIDAATGRYILKNATDWCFVTVDDTPLAVRSVRFAGQPAGATVELSDGTTEALDGTSLRMTAEGVMYSKVRGGEIPARWDRTAAFTLLERAELTAEGGAYVVIGGKRVPIATIPDERVDARDDG